MSKIRPAILVVCLLRAVAAHAADGSVLVYLQPLAPEAARLTFALASISAVTTTGSEHPLELNVKTIRQPDANRQRLLASGRVPMGSYTGFVLKVKQAVLKNAQGEATLAVPGTPVRVDLPFTVSGQQRPIVSFALEYQRSFATESAFDPVFTATMPSRPLPDHAGFVTNSTSNNITVFDRRLTQAVGVIDACAGPSGMALDQRRRQAYVACAKDDEVVSIDVATGEIVERTRVSPGDRPRELALTPDGVTLISVNAGSNSVTFFDAVSLTRQERVNVGSGPASVLVEPTGRRAFVFNTLSSSLSVIDISNRTLVATISTEVSPLRGRFNARGDRIYIIHERSPYMTVLDARQLTIVTRARLRIGVSAIDVDAVRDLVCVGGVNDTEIEFYDPNALMPVYSMRTRAGVSFLKIHAEDNVLYGVSPETRSLIVGRLADRKVVSEIDVGDGAYSVAVMGEK